MAELDLRGQVCPYPTSRTMEALRQLDDGESLVVTSDYPPARSTIPWVAHDAGFHCEIEELDAPLFRVRISKDR